MTVGNTINGLSIESIKFNDDNPKGYIFTLVFPNNKNKVLPKVGVDNTLKPAE